MLRNLKGNPECFGNGSGYAASPRVETWLTISTKKMVSEFHTVYIICYRLHITTYMEDLSRPHQKGTDDYTLSEAALERSSDDLYQVHPAC